MIELEKTYLPKFLPPDLKDYQSKEIIDVYIPKSKGHAAIRIRKKGDKYEITKKMPTGKDFSQLKEQTILIDEEEFKILAQVPGKKVHKIRYYYPYQNLIAEIDIFQGSLKGLVLVEVEFKDTKQRDSFALPDFCLTDITQEDFAAGGMLCGKSYQDIEKELGKFGYKKLVLD